MELRNVLDSFNINDCNQSVKQSPRYRDTDRDRKKVQSTKEKKRIKDRKKTKIHNCKLLNW